MAKITISLMRELEQQVTAGEISYSRMVEILNEQVVLKDTAVQYFKTRPDMVPFKGERFFRFINNSSEVIQVCLEITNETKRGKGHYIGIYKISRVTFFSNYYPNYVVISSDMEFNEAFKKAVKLLSFTETINTEKK